jgi:protein TonB
MHSQTLTPKVNNTDRLGLTLFLATALHAMIILGVSFNLEDHFRKDAPPLSLEIVLVHSKSDETPKKADYLAQTNQKGGGEMEEQVRPSSPFPNPKPVATRQGNAPETREESSPPTEPKRQQSILNSEKRSTIRTQRIEVEPQPTIADRPTAAELMERSIEIARLSAEIRQKQQTYAKKPKVKTISANTREFRDALYLKTWQDKVERVGNLNYPDEAKRSQISGHLTMVVEINPDGSLRKAQIGRSSGKKILDDAALRIVTMAAPFSPFSKEMRKEFEVLRIVRTWKFESGNRFSTQR